VVTGALVIDPDSEPKLADRLARLRNQGAIQCTCDCSWPVCTHPHGMLSDATYNGGLTLSSRFGSEGVWNDRGCMALDRMITTAFQWGMRQTLDPR
jgi:hypothetical protein